MSTVETVTSNATMTKETIRALTVDELDAASGAAPKLMEAACKGKVFHEVVLEVGGTSLAGAAMLGAILGASGGAGAG